MTPQPSRSPGPSRLLPGEKAALKVTGLLLAAGAMFYAGYLVGGAQTNSGVALSERCPSIKAEARKHLDEGYRLFRIHDGQSDGSGEIRMSAHLMINNADCYTPGEVASAQSLLDTINKAS